MILGPEDPSGTRIPPSEKIIATDEMLAGPGTVVIITEPLGTSETALSPGFYWPCGITTLTNFELGSLVVREAEDTRSRLFPPATSHLEEPRKAHFGSDDGEPFNCLDCFSESTRSCAAHASTALV